MEFQQHKEFLAQFFSFVNGEISAPLEIVPHCSAVPQWRDHKIRFTAQARRTLRKFIF
jgi:hypothetical protein